MKFALSTAYHLARNNSPEELVDDTLKLGFSGLELNYEFPEEWASGIKKQVNLGRIKVVSLHNYCPRLKTKLEGRHLLNAYLISSKNPEERKQSVSLTKKTIEYASELGACVVVIHAGKVEFKPSGADLFNVACEKGIDSGEYICFLERLKNEREKGSNIFLQNTLRSLEELSEYAEKKNVILGLENRIYYHEIPLPDEMEFLLERLNENVGYWHDIGHNEVFFRMKLIPDRLTYLERFKSRLVGLHLHDLTGISDHHAPGTGDVDFTVLKPYLNDSLLYVAEIHPFAKEDDVKKSVGYLEKNLLI